MYQLKVEESITDLPKDATTSKTAYNNFSIKCDTTGFSQSYFMCQNVVLAFKKGKLKPEQHSACQKAFKCVSCPALHMMVKEAKEGRVLYYRHYEPAVQNYPDKPMAKPKSEKASWYKPEMNIATTEIVEESSALKHSGIQSVIAHPKPAKPAKPKEAVAEKADLSSDIYKAAMMEAYEREGTQDAAQ